MTTRVESPTRIGTFVPSRAGHTRGTDLSGTLEGAGGIGGLLARSHGYSGGNWSTHNFYHADGNGNVTCLVNSSQGLAASYRYDPYGNLISSSGSLADANVYRFSSKEFHAATATDADVPTNTLTFSLINPPAGATIAANGLFSWRLPVALANTTNLVRIRVTDDGIPNLSDTNSFTVVVHPLVPVTLTPLGYFNGQFQASVTGSLGPDYVLQGGATPTSFTDFATNTPVAMPFIFTNAVSPSNGFYRVRLGP